MIMEERDEVQDGLRGRQKRALRLMILIWRYKHKGHQKKCWISSIDIARSSTSDNIRLVAASIVLDRGHGKPAQVKLPEPVSEFEESMILIGQQLRTKNMNRDAPLMGRSYESDLDSEGD